MGLLLFAFAVVAVVALMSGNVWVLVWFSLAAIAVAAVVTFVRMPEIREREAAQENAREEHSRLVAAAARAVAESTAIREAAAPVEVDLLLADYKKQLAPDGAAVETAVNAAMHAGGLPRGQVDMARDTFIELARKFARPGERVLGVYILTGAFIAPRYDREKLVGFVVILTHGFAVKSGSKRFRVELLGADTATSFVSGDNGVKLRAQAHLGDLHLDERGWAQGPLPPLYAALRVQEAPLNVARSPQSRAPIKKAAVPRPRPVLIRTWRDAELVAVEWMKYWVYTNVAATAVGADGGIDVVSNEAVAQVKAETAATGRPKVQQHHGVAISEGKTAIFFSLAGFTPAARSYAEANAILLFKFDLQGEPEPVNTAALSLVAKRI
jgi:Restriction endonuclease